MNKTQSNEKNLLVIYQKKILRVN